MDGDPSPLHSAEPCHLTLCELMDGNLQLTYHLLVTQLSDDIECEVFVFKTIINQILWRHPRIYQPANLLHHTVVETLSQTLADAGSSQVAVDVESDHQTADGGEIGIEDGMFGIIFLDFDGTYGTLRCIHIGRVVHLPSRLPLIIKEQVDQLLQRFILQRLTQCGILRYRT